MTVTTTIDALQTIHAAVAGVKTAPAAAAFPDQVEENGLPYVLTWPGTYDMEAAGRNTLEATRIYSGACLVAGEASGVGVTTSVNAVWTLLDAFRARYETLIITTENLSTGEVVIKYHDDGGGAGSGSITFRGRKWLGFLFRAEVWEPS